MKAEERPGTSTAGQAVRPYRSAAAADLGGTRLPRRLAPAQRRPQADIGDEIASQQRQNPCEIEEVQPVCPGPGAAAGGSGMGADIRRQGVRPGEQGFEVLQVERSRIGLTLAIR